MKEKVRKLVVKWILGWSIFFGVMVTFASAQENIPPRVTLAPNVSVAQKVAELRKQLENTQKNQEAVGEQLGDLEGRIQTRPNKDEVEAIIAKAIESFSKERPRISGSTEERLQALEKAYEEERAVVRRALFILAEETEYLSKRKMRTGLLNLGPREQLSYVTEKRVAELRKSLNSTASSTLASKKPLETDVQVALRPQ